MLETQWSRFGSIAKSLPFTPGKIFFVLNKADAHFGDFQKEFPADKDGVDRVYSSLSAAYDATVTNRNDVIVLDSSSGHSLASMLTVSKNRVHFVSTEWLAGVKRTQDQRCRVTMGGTTAVTDVAMIRVTGNGCSFRGIKMVTDNTLAQTITCFQDESPNGLLVENCSIHSLGSAQLTATGGSALRLAGDGSEYRKCQIGADTILNTVANQVISIATINSAVAKRVIFEDCYIYTYTSATTHVFVKVVANGDVDRYVTFKNCTYNNFNNSTGALMAVAFSSALSDSGLIHIDGGSFFGCTDVATGAVGNGKMLINAGTPTAGSAGIAVQPIA